MADLGNAWHIPANPEPRGRAGMRDPVGAVVPGAAVTVFSGSQFQGQGSPGNQLQEGSSVFFKLRSATAWSALPMRFQGAAGNNKYYASTISAGTFEPDDVVEYYLRIGYDDHDETFLAADRAGSVTTADEGEAQSKPFSFTVESSAVRGEWGPVFPLRNVAVHGQLLPNGLVLMWGRRDNPDDLLDVHECTPFLWNPSTGEETVTPPPAAADGTRINLFCAGHTFLADGRLIVAGGHLFDGEGIQEATLYDFATNEWAATSLMNKGRWYPTATSLPDGTALAIAGTYTDRPHEGPTRNNVVPQIWSEGDWIPTAPFPEKALPLYPRMHLASGGALLMSGPLEKTWSLDVANGGRWAQVAERLNAGRDYAPAVMYDVDKVIYIGGGNDQGTHRPTAHAEIIDLGANNPRWQATSQMHFARRHHNGTILPDGTVLVTGGTRGGGGPDPNALGFNDLAPGQPVHTAESWDPSTGRWTELASEEVDRCYHSTALLLPDARVLSAGGGEYKPVGDVPNDPEDSHRDAQVFSPPYLFMGSRPQIVAAPDVVQYGERFTVSASDPGDIARISWIRLGSVTHAFNMSQRINFLDFTAHGGALQVTAPVSPNICPPGHYMLFILSSGGVPSVAKLIQIGATGATPAARLGARQALSAHSEAVAGCEAAPDPVAERADTLAAGGGTRVVVGINSNCPYGLGACWGGAHEALLALEGVQHVEPIPDANRSTATVFLFDQGLPALDRWGDQFRSVVHGSYEFRGVEIHLQGRVEAKDTGLFLSGTDSRPPVQLVPLAAGDKIQWDRRAGAPERLEPQEATAYQRLADEIDRAEPARPVTVVGPIEELAGNYRLAVRAFND